jgi:acyl-coenzyme A thioesterase PaaI-like protein
VRTTFSIPDGLDPVQRHPKAVRPGEVIGRHNPACFGCGPDSPRGLHLEVIAGDGFTARTTLVTQPWMEGGPGVVHGGLVSAGMDEVMVKLPLLIDPAAVTAHLEVDFRKPVPVGPDIIFEGRVLGRQRRKIYAEAIAHLGEPDDPLATGVAMFISIDARAHFADHVGASQMPDEYKQRMSRP